MPQAKTPYIEIPDMPRTFEHQLRWAAMQALGDASKMQVKAAEHHTLITHMVAEGDLRAAHGGQDFREAATRGSIAKREFAQFLNYMADLEADRKAYCEAHIKDLQALKANVEAGNIKIISSPEELEALLVALASNAEEQSHVTKN